MKSKLLFLFAWISFIAIQVNAQIIFDAEIRPRSEFRNGFQTPHNPGDVPEFVTNQRTAFGLLYTNEGVSGRLSLHDVHTWGQNPTKTPATNFMVKEAWLEFGITDSIKVKAGRQILSYNDERILAATNWNHYGTQHDVAVFKARLNKLNYHLGLAYNNESAGMRSEIDYSLSFYKAMIFNWGNYSFSKQLNVSILGVTDWNDKGTAIGGNFVRHTYGGSMDVRPMQNLHFLSNSYYQFGKNQLGQKVSAYLFTLRGDYSLSPKTVVYTGTDVYSGSDPASTSSKTHNFDRLFGAKHKFLGIMDYFPITNSGIQTIFVGANYKISSATKVDAAFHFLRLPHEYTDSSTGLGIDSFLGTEFDVKFSHKFSNELSAGLIHGIMFGTESMCVVKGGDKNCLNNFLSVFITYKPTFSLN